MNIHNYTKIIHCHLVTPQIAKFMGPTWGPTGSCRPQMGPMLVPWTLLSGYRCPPGRYFLFWFWAFEVSAVLIRIILLSPFYCFSVIYLCSWTQCLPMNRNISANCCYISGHNYTIVQMCDRYLITGVHVVIKLVLIVVLIVNANSMAIFFTVQLISIRLLHLLVLWILLWHDWNDITQASRCLKSPAIQLFLGSLFSLIAKYIKVLYC